MFEWIFTPQTNEDLRNSPVNTELPMPGTNLFRLYRDPDQGGSTIAQANYTYLEGGSTKRDSGALNFAGLFSDIPEAHTRVKTSISGAATLDFQLFPWRNENDADLVKEFMKGFKIVHTLLLSTEKIITPPNLPLSYGEE
jgi:hypothetical protein